MVYGCMCLCSLESRSAWTQTAKTLAGKNPGLS